MASLHSPPKFILLFFLIFLHTKQCLSSEHDSMLLSLKTHKKLSSFSPRKRFSNTTANKLTFHHNITLEVSLSVGTPPQKVTMALDTASELSWLHCKREPGLPSVFNPNASTTFSKVGCRTPTCRTQTKNLTIPVTCDKAHSCHFVIPYTDASTTAGDLAFDTFRLGSSPKPDTVFGCMDSGTSSTPEEDRKTTGLMGMNRGLLSFVSQMAYRKFSFCISNFHSAGVLLLGNSNSAWLPRLNYTPFVEVNPPLPYFDRGAYSVQIEGVKVNHKLLPIPKSAFSLDNTGGGQTMVDSATQFTYLLPPIYNALKKEFLAQTKGVLRVLNEPDFMYQGVMDLCYLIDASHSIPKNVPEVSLVFTGAEMRVSGEKLLYRVEDERRGKDSVWCFTFGNADLLDLTANIIGHHHQLNVWMEFDIEKKRIGFSEFKCNVAGQKLGLRL